ncbi:sulfurtransferase TusA family protein [Psychrobacter sp. SWN149]|uniref:sulfurtransferase TusA family protein n=1 Tax=Psychrobacter sp. SWN149 TaxID=2792057 RepID=UPI0018CCEA3B|nr:sulfurtransferase TusA family protein [Psychrobacter sp. SWN149]MBH0005258.1 sulfurtransferase TusA family protein [Psychrobacter sp. SWN149]
MSADTPSIINRMSHAISLSANLSDTEQHSISSLMDLLPAECADSKSGTEQTVLDIKGFVDGCGLACPMPLLKTKVALRGVSVGESLYVVATDPNSRADITAFCRQSQQAHSLSHLNLVVNAATEITESSAVNSTSLQRFDTIYHFIITKTDSN